MRKDFHPMLLNHMRQDKRIFVITGDLGFGMFEKIANEFPDRFYNVAAAEQCMLGVAIGLAEEGMIPLCYTISPFYWRAAEWIRNYVNHEKIPVKLVLAGRDLDYGSNGFSHDATDMRKFFDQFPNIIGYWPENAMNLEKDLSNFLYNKEPSYLNLKR
jgi:transketolase